MSFNELELVSEIHLSPKAQHNQFLLLTMFRAQVRHEPTTSSSIDSWLDVPRGTSADRYTEMISMRFLLATHTRCFVSFWSCVLRDVIFRLSLLLSDFRGSENIANNISMAA